MATSNQTNASRASVPFDLLRAIDESLAEGVYAVDRHGNLIFLNRAAQRTLGWTEKELFGKNMHEVIHYKRPDGTPFPVDECPLLEVLQTGEARSSDEDHFVRRDGKTFPVAYTSSPIIANGEIVGAVVAFRDVTETKRIERELREQKETLEVISRVGQVLVSDLDLPRIIQNVTSAAAEAIGARSAIFTYEFTDERGAPQSFRATVGIPPEDVQQITVFRAADLFGQNETKIERLADARRSPLFKDSTAGRLLESSRIVSLMLVPVSSRTGEVNGVLVLGHPQANRFTERDERVAAGLAAQAAIAIDNARLFALAERARARAEASERAWQFLAEATALLASSLDYEKMLANLARLSVPSLADWCVIDLLQDGRLQRLAVEHMDRTKVELVHELERRCPTDLSEEEGIAKALRTKSAVIYQTITDDLLQKLARDQEQLRILRRLGLRSVMILPLVARGRVLGAISFATAESNRYYTQDDLRVAEHLARRAAIALDNALLYSATQEANRLKEESLRALRASEARLRSLFESDIIGIIFADLRGNILDANDAFLQMVGRTRQEIEEGRLTWRELTPPEYLPLDEEKIAEARATGRSKPWEKEYLRRDGSRLPVLIGFTLIEGSPDQAVAFVLDISERKRAEEKLARLYREREMLLEEVSTPVVPVWQGVLVMPLIGPLDNARMKKAIETALNEVARTGARALIVDITGARIADSQAVANLYSLVSAIELLGAEAVVAGVGAQAARSLVGLRLDLEGLRTQRTLAEALASLIKKGDYALSFS
ncbi:MAG: hypothetical protein C4334_03905 [Pyrinomonas sp.]